MSARMMNVRERVRVWEVAAYGKRRGGMNEGVFVTWLTFGVVL